MEFTLEELERNYQNGLTPDWVYYQLNGASAQENYITWQRQNQARTLAIIKEQLMQKNLESKIDSTIGDLLKDMNYNYNIKFFL